LARRIEDDEGIGARLLALARSDEEIHRRHPAGQLAEQVRARIEAGRPAAPFSPGGRYWPVPVALAAAAMVFAMLGPRVQGPVAPSTAPLGEPTERIKGLKPSLAVFRKTAEHS